MKSNRSALSSLSSYTAKSAYNRSARKYSKISKSPNSIKRQQEEEYDKLSAKKRKTKGKIVNVEKRSSRVTLSAKKRKESVSSRPLVGVVTKGRTQTILIDAEGLSQQQIRQIDRVTRIINNEVSPKKKVYKKVALSRQHLSDRASDNSQKKSDATSRSARKKKSSNLVSNRSNDINRMKSKRPNFTSANRSANSRSQGKSKKSEERSNNLNKDQKRQTSKSHDYKQIRNQKQQIYETQQQIVQPLPFFKSFGERIIAIPSHTNHMQTQFQRSTITYPEYEYNSPNYTIDYSQKDNFQIANDAKSLEKKQIYQSQSGLVHENQNNGQHIYQQDNQTNNQSISTQLYKPVYLNSLRTIQETKSPPPEEQKSIQNEVNDNILSQNTIQPNNNGHTITPSKFGGSGYPVSTQQNHRLKLSQFTEGNYQIQTKLETQQTQPANQYFVVDNNQYQPYSSQMECFYSPIQQSQKLDERVLDNLSQMQDHDKKQRSHGKHKNQNQRFKSYNNDDINDVAPNSGENEISEIKEEEQRELQEEQPYAQKIDLNQNEEAIKVGQHLDQHAPQIKGIQSKKVSDNASILTNSNTVNSHLTKQAQWQPQNNHVASKRTFGTEIQMNNPRMSTQNVEHSETQREIKEEYSKTYVCSSNTSNIDGIAMNYVTDHNSYVGKHNQKQLALDSLGNRINSDNNIQIKSDKQEMIDSPDIKSRNETMGDQKKEIGPPSNYENQNINTQEKIENNSPNINFAYTLFEPEKNTTNKFISFNDSQQIQKQQNQNTLQNNINVVSGTSQNSLEQTLLPISPQNQHQMNQFKQNVTLNQDNSIVQANSTLISQQQSANYAGYPPFLEQPAMTFSSNSPAIYTNQVLSPVTTADVPTIQTHMVAQNPSSPQGQFQQQFQHHNQVIYQQFSPNNHQFYQYQHQNQPNILIAPQQQVPHNYAIAYAQQQPQIAFQNNGTEFSHRTYSDINNRINTQTQQIPPYLFYPHTDMLQSQHSSENVHQSNMNIQSQNEPASPQDNIKRINRQSSTRIDKLAKNTTPSKKMTNSTKKKRRVTSLNNEPKKNIIAFQILNSKRSKSRGQTRNQEIAKSFISMRLNSDAQKIILPSNVTTSRGKQRSTRFKKKSKSQVSNLSVNSKKSKKLKKESKKESRSKSFTSQRRASKSQYSLVPIYQGPCEFNDGIFNVMIVEDSNQKQFILKLDQGNQGQLVPIKNQRIKKLSPPSLGKTEFATQSYDNQSIPQNHLLTKQQNFVMDNTFNSGEVNKRIVKPLNSFQHEKLQDSLVNELISHQPTQKNADVIRESTGKECQIVNQKVINSNQFHIINEQSENIKTTQLTQERDKDQFKLYGIEEQSDIQKDPEDDGNAFRGESAMRESQELDRSSVERLEKMLQQTNSQTLQPVDQYSSVRNTKPYPHLLTQGVIELENLQPQTYQSDVILYQPGSVPHSGPATSNLSKSKLVKHLETPSFVQQGSLTFNQLRAQQMGINKYLQESPRQFMSSDKNDSQKLIPNFKNYDYMQKSSRPDEGSVESQRQPRGKKRNGVVKRNQSYSHVWSDDNYCLTRLSSLQPTIRRNRALLSEYSGSQNFTNILVPIRKPMEKKKKQKKSKKRNAKSAKSKSRHSLRSAKDKKSKQGKVSIDKTGEGIRVEDVKEALFSSGKCSSKIERVQSNNLLPNKKIITPNKSNKKHFVSVDDSKKQQNRKLRFHSTKKKAKQAYDVQQRSINRLYSSVPRRFVKEDFGEFNRSIQTPQGILRQPKAMRSYNGTPQPQNPNHKISFTHQSPILQTLNRKRSASHRRSRSLLSLKKIGKEIAFKKVEPAALRSFNQRFQEYRTSLKALEKAKYEKLLEQQKQEFQLKIKNMNLNTQNRLAYMKQNLQREKQKSIDLQEELEKFDPNFNSDKKNRTNKDYQLMQANKKLKKSRSKSKKRDSSKLKLSQRKAQKQIRRSMSRKQMLEQMQNNQSLQQKLGHQLISKDFIYKPEEILGGTNGILSDSVNSNSVSHLKQSGGSIKSRKRNLKSSESRKRSLTMNNSKERVTFENDIGDEKPSNKIDQMGSFDLKSGTLNSKDLSRSSQYRKKTEGGKQSILKPAKSLIDFIQPCQKQDQEASFNNLCDQLGGSITQKNKLGSPIENLSRQTPLGQTFATEFTQTSASSGVWPTERWTSITQQFKQNQRDIKRIEKILYKNDKQVPKKNKLLEGSQKYQQLQNKMKQITERQIENKMSSGRMSKQVTMISDRQSQASRKYNKTEQFLMEIPFVNKAMKIDQIDKAMSFKGSH